MTIPSYDKFMLPILKVAGDGREHTMEEIYETMAKQFSITEAELDQRNEGGQRTFLKKAGLVDYTGTGRFKITAEGIKALSSSPSEITLKFLSRYPTFREFR